MRQLYFKGAAGMKRNTTRRGVLGAILGALALTVAGHTPVMAAGYPDRPVKLIVPFPAGGSTDTAARIMAKGLQEALSGNFVVENRAGAAGTVGMGAALRAKPDGYTLGVGPVGATIIAQLIGMQVPYDPVNDIVPIANMGSLPLVFAVKSDLDVKTLGDLVAMAKSKPGALSYGTSGAGTPGHLAFEYFMKLSGVDLVHVPYKGDAPLATDLQGGQLEVGILTGPAAVAQADSDKMKYLAVTSGVRYPQLSQVPTVAESGFKDFNITIWNLLVAPKGTDASLISTLNGAMNKVLSMDSTKETLKVQGYLPSVIMGTDETAAFVNNERKTWETIVSTTGVKIPN
jgi:tripartite-type tricarboxylate transporter receptor subunit TctC